MTRNYGSLRRKLVPLLLGITLVALRPPAPAQTDGGSIIGLVSDESGAILPGVTVTARVRPCRSRELTAVTNEQGEYRLAPLADRDVSGRVCAVGISGRPAGGHPADRRVRRQAGHRDESRVDGGDDHRLRAVAAGGRELDRHQPHRASRRETLEVNPSGRNGLIALLGQAPGVRTNLDVGGSTLNSTPVFKAFGQDGEPWETLEGVSTASVNGNQAGVYWDYATMEEVNVQASGNNADIPTRGVALIGVVKSGGNDFHGGAWWSQTSKRFQSDNIDDALAAKGITAGESDSEAAGRQRGDRRPDPARQALVLRIGPRANRFRPGARNVQAGRLAVGRGQPSVVHSSAKSPIR